MYNNNDEMFETSDFDEDVQSREALIEEAKNINMDADWNEIMHEITNLKKDGKKFHTGNQLMKIN